MGERLSKIPQASEFCANAMRNEINSMLLECTEEQVAFLNKIHDLAPWKGWANCPSDHLADNFNLVVRTLEGNRK